ncbi:transposase, partial [Mycobacterium tuberculosis TKK-01-0007]
MSGGSSRRYPPELR